MLAQLMETYLPDRTLALEAITQAIDKGDEPTNGGFRPSSRRSRVANRDCGFQQAGRQGYLLA